MAWQMMVSGKMDPYTMLTVANFPGTGRMRKYFKEQLEKLEALQAQQAANGQVPTDGAQQQLSAEPDTHLKDSGDGANDLAALPSAAM